MLSSLFIYSVHQFLRCLWCLLCLVYLNYHLIYVLYPLPDPYTLLFTPHFYTFSLLDYTGRFLTWIYLNERTYSKLYNLKYLFLISAFLIIYLLLIIPISFFKPMPIDSFLVNFIPFNFFLLVSFLFFLS